MCSSLHNVKRNLDSGRAQVLLILVLIAAMGKESSAFISSSIKTKKMTKDHAMATSDKLTMDGCALEWLVWTP